MLKPIGAALLLAALLLVSSCGAESAQSTVPGESEDHAAGTVPAEGTEEPDAAEPEIELPAADYNGESISIATFSLWGDHYLYADEQNGDPLNDAIFRRNAEIEEAYHVKFGYTVYDQTPAEVSRLVKQSVSAGDHAVDLAMTTCQEAFGLASGGYLSELSGIPNIDLSHPWWDQGSIRDLSVAHRQYYAMNSLCLLADNFTAAVFFNKDMIASNALEDPYALADSGKWTWEKMYEMAKNVSADTDSDGKMTDKDTYGMVGSFNLMMDSMMNCNEPIIVKDADDLPVFALNTQRAADVGEALLGILADTHHVLLVDRYIGQYNDAWQDLMYPAFMSGKCLFVARAYVQYVYYFRESSVNYGILPRPKYDAEQKEYSSDINYAWATTFMIPKDVKDPAMAGHITEALAQASLKYVTPANYDVSIVTKQLRDTDSERMLDIIYASRHYDMGQFTDFSTMKASLVDMLKKNEFTFGSDYASVKPKTEKNIEKFVEEFSQIED